jgi:hypothetical protein
LFAGDYGQLLVFEVSGVFRGHFGITASGRVGEMNTTLIRRAIAIEDDWMLNDCKKWERLRAIGVCRFCLLALMGKWESEVGRLSAQGLNADLYDPECGGCSLRKTNVSAGLLSLAERVAGPTPSRLYPVVDQAKPDALPHNPRQTTME